MEVKAYPIVYNDIMEINDSRSDQDTVVEATMVLQVGDDRFQYGAVYTSSTNAVTFTDPSRIYFYPDDEPVSKDYDPDKSSGINNKFYFQTDDDTTSIDIYTRITFNADKEAVSFSVSAVKNGDQIHTYSSPVYILKDIQDTVYPESF